MHPESLSFAFNSAARAGAGRVSAVRHTAPPFSKRLVQEKIESKTKTPVPPKKQAPDKPVAIKPAFHDPMLALRIDLMAAVHKNRNRPSK